VLTHEGAVATELSFDEKTIAVFQELASVQVFRETHWVVSGVENEEGPVDVLQNVLASCYVV